MKKISIQAAMAVVLAMSGVSYGQAAEIYHKNGNKLDLSGKLDGLHYFSKNKKLDGDFSYVRLKLMGETQINDDFYGYGQWEYNMRAQNPESSDSAKNNATRLSFAGLKFKNLGSIDYGRNNGVMYDISSWTDVIPEFGGDSYSFTDNFMTQRTSNVLTWHNSDFFGLVDRLNVTLQYQGKNGGIGETNNGRAYRAQNGDGFGMSASWSSDTGIFVGAAYSSANRTAEQQRYLDGDKAQAWNMALKYDNYGVYLAALYAETTRMTPFGDFSRHDDSEHPDLYSSAGFANKTQNFELIAQYYFGNGLMPSIGYLQSQGKDIQLNGVWYGDQPLVKYLDIAAAYNFNKNAKVYVDYKINLLNKNDFIEKTGIAVDNILALAVMYKF